MRAGIERWVALAALTLAACAIPGTVAATPLTDVSPPAAPTVVGTLQGSSEWAPAAAHCDVAPVTSVVVSGTFSASFIGPGRYSGSIVRPSDGACPATFGSGPEFAVAGTLTFSGRGGTFVATIDPGSTGAASESPHAAAYDFHLVLTITSGVRRYAMAHGSFTLDYSTNVSFAFGCPCSPTDAGTISGSIFHGAGSAA